MLTETDLDLLYQALCHDSCFPPKRKAFNRLVENAEELEFKAKKNIVEYGTVDTSIWIVARGMTRLAYYSEDKEITYGFGAQGTLFCSPLGFFRGEAANFHLIAVTDVVMLRISKVDFVSMLTTDIEISNWFSGAVIGQMMACEIKVNIHSYSTVERIERFMKGQLEEDYKIKNKNMSFNLHQIPMRVLASYFGITRSHMAHIIKKMYAKDSEQTEFDMEEE